MIGCKYMKAHRSRDLVAVAFITGGAHRTLSSHADIRSKRILRWAGVIIQRIIPVVHPLVDIAFHIQRIIITFALQIIDHIGRAPDIVFEIQQISRRQAIAPRIDIPLRAARSLFPLRFGRQMTIDILAICLTLRPHHTHHRIVLPIEIVVALIIRQIRRCAFTHRHTLLEFTVGDLGTVNPKITERDGMLEIIPTAMSHDEGTARHRNQQRAVEIQIR